MCQGKKMITSGEKLPCSFVNYPKTSKQEQTFMTPCWMRGEEWLTRTRRASGWMSLSITSSSRRSGSRSRTPLSRSYKPQQIRTRQSSALDLNDSENTHMNHQRQIFSCDSEPVNQNTQHAKFTSFHGIITEITTMLLWYKITHSVIKVQPKKKSILNGHHCWNWFKKRQQVPDTSVKLKFV